MITAVYTEVHTGYRLSLSVTCKCLNAVICESSIRAEVELESAER